MIAEGYKANFETLKRAAADGNLAIMDCQDKATGEQVIVICAVGYDGNEYTMVPLAKMFDGNPYDELNPPAPEGGYSDEKAKRIQEIKDRMAWMQENLEGCDWCCGGGDEEMEALTNELKELEG